MSLARVDGLRPTGSSRVSRLWRSALKASPSSRRSTTLEAVLLIHRLSDWGPEPGSRTSRAEYRRRRRRRWWHAPIQARHAGRDPRNRGRTLGARHHGGGADLREHRGERRRQAPRAAARRSHLVAHRRQRGTRPIVVTTGGGGRPRGAPQARARRRDPEYHHRCRRHWWHPRPRKENRMYGPPGAACRRVTGRSGRRDGQRV
jgi:hypothetical protein